MSINKFKHRHKRKGKHQHNNENEIENTHKNESNNKNRNQKKMIIMVSTRSTRPGVFSQTSTLAFNLPQHFNRASTVTTGPEHVHTGLHVLNWALLVLVRARIVKTLNEQFSLCRQFLDPSRIQVGFNSFNQAPTSLKNCPRTILNWDSAV